MHNTKHACLCVDEKRQKGAKKDVVKRPRGSRKILVVAIPVAMMAVPVAPEIRDNLLLVERVVLLSSPVVVKHVSVSFGVRVQAAERHLAHVRRDVILRATDDAGEVVHLWRFHDLLITLAGIAQE